MNAEQRTGIDRRKVVSVGGLGALGLGLTGLLAACSSEPAGASDTTGSIGDFVKTPKWKFVVVNHATTNSFFTPTLYGAQDAAAMVGCSVQWTGSESGKVTEMVSAMQTAIDAGADGIALSLIDAAAFTSVIAKATAKGIPVVGYSSDAPASGRLSYVGTDNAAVGSLMGQRVVELVKSGSIALFAAQPTASYVTPRIAGIEDAAKTAGLTTDLVTSGFTINDSVSKVQAYLNGHPEVKGIFGLDAYATQAIGQVIKTKSLKGKVVGGGYDALDVTMQLLQGGYLSFIADEQAYLQGFMPVLELFLYNLSGGQSGPADVNPGVKFVDPAGAAVCTKTKSRFEGSTKVQKLIEVG